jgi:TonB-linked SusC/RagA family outer membrane protein
MKMLVIIICGLSLLSSYGKSYSQNTKLTFDFEDTTVEAVLQYIEDQSDYSFMYDNNKIDVTRKVDIRVKDEPISSILDQLFNNEVRYQLVGKHVIITPSSVDGQVVNVVSQQQKRVIGKVTDSSGSPLPGVSVVAKGTVYGTITDANGNYALNNISDNTTLVFSFVGMQAQEVFFKGQAVVNVVMTEDLIGIEEVVAVGYGTMRKSDLTGSSIRIDMTKMERRPNTNLSQVLSGHFPGVNASSAGDAGSTGSISVRGTTTLSASEFPLIVLDGIIYNGSLSNINPNDIETIDVLKDASSAAVYGARSANGVLLINTKRGKSEKPTFEFNAYYGYQDIGTTKRTKVMNGEQFAISRVDHAYQQILRTWYQTGPTDASLRPVRPDITNRQLVASYLRTQEEKDNYMEGNEVDWVDEVLQIAPIQNYDLNVSGSTGRTNYFLSASYTDQKGIQLNDHFKRQTLRANFENEITNWFTLRLNTSYSYLDNSGISASLARGLVASPLADIYTPEGNYTMSIAGDPYVRNPLEDIVVDNVNASHNVFMALSGKIEIPGIKGLTYEINYSRSLNFGKNNTFYPSTNTLGLAESGRGIKDLSESKDWLLNNILTYKRTIKDNHRVNATLVYTQERRAGEGSYLEARGFDNEMLGYNALEIGTNKDVNSSAWEESNLAFMARVNYSYKDRYMITATFRRDGYSGFGVDNKYASFPSVSLGYTISEESFLDGADWLNLLKLRISYGLNGNQGIGAYASQATMATTNYVFGGSTAVGLYPNTMGNPGLRWESTATFNLGLDYSIIDQRISGEIDVYKSRSSDVLVQRTVPQTTGYSKIWDNVSKIKNKGIELAINTVNIKNPIFNWSSRFIFSLNRNEIVELYEGVTEDRGNRWFVGEPIHAHYDLQVNGVWQEDDLFKGTILSPYLPGDMKLVDLNGDKVIDDEDRSIIGYPDPNYRFGINNDFSYKNFTLSVFINSIQGGNGYYIDDPGEDASRAGGADRALRTNRTALFDYWRPDNPVNNQPAMFYPYEGVHGMYFERSFVRLQDVSLSYSFSKKITNLLKLNNLQVYVSGKNLYTWTDWPSYDPEMTGSVPMMRSMIFGLKASF